VNHYLAGLGGIAGLALLGLGFILLPWGEITLETFFSYLWCILVTVSVLAFFREYRRKKLIKEIRKQWRGKGRVKKERAGGRVFPGRRSRSRTSPQQVRRLRE